MVERLMGVGPTWPAWEAGALPLSYRRSRVVGASLFKDRGGRGGIRARGRLAPTAVFKTAALGRSATRPVDGDSIPNRGRAVQPSARGS